MEEKEIDGVLLEAATMVLEVAERLRFRWAESCGGSEFIRLG
jgi:hypothetical protein